MKTILLAALVLASAPVCAADNVSGLLRAQTQAMVDAIAPGQTAIWQRNVDDRASFTDENGVLQTKAQLLSGLKPLPPGLSGNIQVTEWKATLVGDAAITTYIEDEHENYHGQHLHALYRTTDTWLKEPAGWRLVAEQTIALQQDPPAMALPVAALDQYAGRYTAGQGYIYTITRSDNQLMGAAAGGKPQALKAELADVLFTPGQPRTRKIFQRDAHGNVTGFLSRREERAVVWTKLK